MDSIIVPLAFFGLMAYVVHAVLSALVRTRLVTRQSQVLTRFIESAGQGGVPAFLDSPAGRSLLQGHVDRRTFMLSRVLSAVHAFIVLTIGGIAMLVFRGRVAENDERAAIEFIAIFGITLGGAFLLAAGVAFALSKRWGLLESGAPDR
ncbi:MAG: hypothetical protein L0271_02490 [Gemmatimonadetes bacterium]|nr:hypothetical protein [Gemmatimonadota bacterium]